MSKLWLGGGGGGRWKMCKQDFYSKRIEYILEWNLDNPSVWMFSVPFSLTGSSMCTNHVNVHKLYAVKYINTVCTLDYCILSKLICQNHYQGEGGKCVRKTSFTVNKPRMEGRWFRCDSDKKMRR